MLVLSDLWGSQGAKVTPGSYELITISGKASTKYPLTVEASSPKPTNTSTTSTTSTTTSTAR